MNFASQIRQYFERRTARELLLTSLRVLAVAAVMIVGGIALGDDI